MSNGEAISCWNIRQIDWLYKLFASPLPIYSKGFVIKDYTRFHYFAQEKNQGNPLLGILRLPGYIYVFIKQKTVFIKQKTGTCITM